MKLPRLRRKPAPETAEPASVGPAAPVLQVVIYSNTDTPEHEFMAQTEKLRRVASYDNATRSWYSQIPFDRPEWAAAGTSASGRGSAARPIRAWLQRVTTGAARRLSPWTGTWTGVRGIPSAIFAFTGGSARRRCW